MKVKILLCICCLSPLLSCRAATVRLLTGETYKGKAAINADGITIAPGQGAPAKVDPANVLDALFDATPTYQQGTVPPGVLLVNGSFLAGKVDPEACQAPTVKIGSAGITIPSTAIAQVLVLAVDPSKLRPQSGGGPGAMANNGDFLAGKIDGMHQGRLQVNSALLGPEWLTPGKQISGWVIRDVQNTNAAYEVTSRDGSRYVANGLKMDGTSVSLTDSIAGSVTVKAEDLMEIRAGAARYQSLAQATPVRIEPPPGASVTNGFKVQPSSPGAPDSAPAILSAVNAKVSYALPPGFSVLTGSVAVSKDSPATARLVFDIYADGRLLFGSPVVASGAAPQPIHVNLGSAHTITLRAEPADPGSNGATAEWIDPILLPP